MLIPQMHESSTGQYCPPSFFVLEPEASEQYPLFQVQLLTIGEDVRGPNVEPVAPVEAESEAQPVRQIDEILVLDDAPGNGGCDAVIAASEIGARIMDGICLSLWCRPSGGKVSVAERA